jgi:hypothetical protein
MPDALRGSVLLSVQRALLGEITPNMRAISVSWSPREILIRVYIDGPIPRGLQDDFEAGMAAQVVADFVYPDQGDPAVLPCEFIRVDAPQRVPHRDGEVFVFKRREPSE